MGLARACSSSISSGSFAVRSNQSAQTPGQPLAPNLLLTQVRPRKLGTDAQILFGHEEECARTAAGQRMKLLLPGTALYAMALASTWLFIPDGSMLLVPSLLFAAGAAPNVYEWFLFATTSYKRALPYNHHYGALACGRPHPMSSSSARDH